MSYFPLFPFHYLAVGSAGRAFKSSGGEQHLLGSHHLWRQKAGRSDVQSIPQALFTPCLKGTEYLESWHWESSLPWGLRAALGVKRTEGGQNHKGVEFPYL